MSVNDSIDDKTYSIKIEVPEEFIEQIISKKKKPTNLLSNIIKQISSNFEINEIIKFAEGKDSDFEFIDVKKRKESSDKRQQINYRNWTYSEFENYMQKLVIQAENRASRGDLISMLIAYLDTSSRPTSEELREARGFGPGEKWYEELRTSKSILTITAKHLNLPSFFLRAYGSGLNRRHPIDNEIYHFLQEWSSKNEAIIQQYRKTAIPRSID